MLISSSPASGAARNRGGEIGALLQAATHLKTTSTCGMNSCGSGAGTTKFPRWWYAGKPRRESAIVGTFRLHFNLLTPMKGVYRSPGRVGTPRSLATQRAVATVLTPPRYRFVQPD